MRMDFALRTVLYWKKQRPKGKGDRQQMTGQKKLVRLMNDAPIIAAVKNDAELDKALESGCSIVFFLYGSLMTVSAQVERVTAAGKCPIVHIDLIDGLSTKRDIAVDFICEKTAAEGIISTRPQLIRRAKERGLIAIQRFFLLDSLAFGNVVRQQSEADAVDILPGTMPKIVRRLAETVRSPIIASGLISDKEDIIAALSAGASAVSTTSAPLWFA